MHLFSLKCTCLDVQSARALEYGKRDTEVRSMYGIPTL